MDFIHVNLTKIKIPEFLFDSFGIYFLFSCPKKSKMEIWSVLSSSMFVNVTQLTFVDHSFLQKCSNNQIRNFCQ